MVASNQGEARGTAPWIDAPVFVDAIASEQPAPIVRVTYLTIECVEPEWGWSLSIRGDTVPIGLLGLAAVVLRPFNDELFRQPSQFDDLIRRVESQPGFSVETGDLWLPRFLFDAPLGGHPKPAINGQLKTGHFE